MIIFFWRPKVEKKNFFKATAPGQYVSIDQIISTQVGFVAQIKGRLTKFRYLAATVFVGHYSRTSYVYLMYHLTSNKTLQAKRAYGQWSENHGVTIQNYHCDNGRFSDNAFISHWNDNRQQVTFCGVNERLKNGIYERAINNTRPM